MRPEWFSAHISIGLEEVEGCHIAKSENDGLVTLLRKPAIRISAAKAVS